MKSLGRNQSSKYNNNLFKLKKNKKWKLKKNYLFLLNIKFYYKIINKLLNPKSKNNLKKEK